MSTKGTTVEPVKLSVADRRALRTIVKDRFKAIRKGLVVRQNQAYDATRQAIRQATEDATREARAETSALVTEFTEHAKGFDKELAKFQKKAEALQKKYQKKGVTLEYPPNPPRLSWELSNQWTIGNPRDILNDEWRRINTEVAQVTENLDRQEQELIESLILGDITEDARAFLEKVPTLDSLVPLPSPEELQRKMLGQG